MRTLLLTLALATAVGACSPLYYPNASYSSLPVEPGEVVATARASTSGLEGQILVAPLKSVVVGGSATWLYLPGEMAFTRHSYGELAGGWSDTSGRAFFGVIAGAGIGRTATPPGSRYPWDDRTFDSASYTRVFAQATLGSLALERSIEPGERANSGFAFGLRLAWVRATRLYIDEREQPPTSDLFIEPTVSWHRTGERIGLEVDLGVSMSPQSGTRLHSSPLRLGVGLIYSVADLF